METLTIKRQGTVGEAGERGGEWWISELGIGLIWNGRNGKRGTAMEGNSGVICPFLRLPHLPHPHLV